MKLTILHIADLHCSPADQLYLKPVALALCSDLKAQLEDGKKPDLVCVTGDIVDKGQNCFNLADDLFFKPIQEVLQISPKHFYFVPGNHDVDRKQISDAIELGCSNL